MTSEKKTNSKPSERKNNKTEVSTVPPFEIDYDKLAEAIVIAELKAKEELEEIEIRKQKQAEIERLKIFGYKEDKKFSSIVAKLKMLFFAKKEDIQGDNMTLTLLKYSVENLLTIGEYILYILSVISLLVFSKVNRNGIIETVVALIICVLLAFAFLTLARSARISKFEIENMKNRDYLNVIVGSLMTVLATVIALIEFFRGIS